MLRESLHVDEILPWPASLGETVRLVREIRRRTFDCVIDAFGNPRTAWVTLFSGCRHRIGYDVRVRRWAYRQVVPRLPAGHYNSRVQLELLRPLGIEAAGDRLQLFLASVERKWAQETLAKLGVAASERPIGVNPGGSWSTKRWWANRYGRLAAELAERPGGTVLVLWGPGEEAIAREVESTARHPRVRAIPSCSLRQMAALIERMRLLVTNDAAAKHIAVALGTPSLTLHGPTDPRAWHPEGGAHRILVGEVPCAPCERTTCGHRSCMVRLTVPEVTENAREMLPGR